MSEKSKLHRAQKEARQEKQAKKLINWIFGGLIVLAVVYLNCDQNYWLKDISIQYVFFYNKNIAGFNFLIYSIIIIVSFIVSLIRIKKAILHTKGY